MSQLEDRVRHHLGLSIEAQIAVVDTLSADIARAGERLVNCLLNDGKILICGHGGSAANSLHFSSALLTQYEAERPALPVISLSTDMALLTAISNEGHAEQCFARQIRALGHARDLLIVLTASGNSSGILEAVKAANDREMEIIALSGKEGGLLSSHLGPDDMEIRVPGERLSGIREIHLVILHCFCDLIDQLLFRHLQE